MAKHITTADRVNGILRQRGWRSTPLARHLKISIGYLSQICSGTRRPAKYQARIARLVKMALADLWGEFLADELKGEPEGARR